jgi:hypothetical protein
VQKLSTHAKRVATKMIVKVKQFKIAKLEETRYDSEVSNNKKEERIIIHKSEPLDRWLIISEKRLFIVMKKKNTVKTGVAENKRHENEAVDSGMEIIDSIPFHEIASIDIWRKDGNQPKDITEDGRVLLSKSDQQDKSDQNLKNGFQFLRISTLDDGFNCGNSFCISELEQIHSGEFSKDTISALREYHVAAKKVFNNKTYLRKTQVWDSYRACPAEILSNVFREITCFSKFLRQPNFVSRHLVFLTRGISCTEKNAEGVELSLLQRGDSYPHSLEFFLHLQRHAECGP